jgi:endonuclease YncB( thermonuclease family)
MKKIFIICLITITVLFAEDKNYGDAIVSEITSIYDGDTFRCTIEGYPAIIGERIGIRVNGIDCPEMKDKRQEIKEKARQAKQYAVKRLREGKVIKLTNMKRGKYFRIVADVIVDGKSLGQELLGQGLAKPYDGGTKEAW